MRKSLLNLALIGLLSCTACSSPQSKATIIQNIPLTGYKLDSELASIMVISPHAPENCALIKALSDEFVGSHNIIVHWIDDTSSTDSLFDSINQTKPSAIVLLDNSAVSLFETYQQQKPEQIHPPAVVAMTVFLELVIDGLKNATGVTYEVPGVASLTALRNVSRQPIKRVGLVFRETFQWLIDTQQTLLEKENFTLIGQKVSDFPKPSELQNALSQLQSNNIDVLWILNDIGLFDHGALEKAWMPFIYKYNYPTIVGVESFLKQSTPLGTLAILPDHSALGLQVASLLFSVLDFDGPITLDDFPIEQPISVRTVVQKNQLNKSLPLTDNASDHIDEWYQE